ncbi:MAG: exo-alpha-sialidase, partial [Gammaproteobacteria bacterium]|nr:exo-alpha-sialidase [Gammaproteobacteria bacterium]
MFNLHYTPTLEGSINVEISTNTPSRTYQKAGIKIPNEYSFMNNSCSDQQGQTCVYSVSDTSPIQLTISGPSGVINNTLCLNQKYQLNCESSRIVYLTNSVVSGTNSVVSGTEVNGVIYSGVNNSKWDVYSSTDFINNQFKAIFCSNEGTSCIVGGFYGTSNSDYKPAVFYSLDKGMSWTQADDSQMVQGLSSYPIQVWDMDCNAETGHCVAGGLAGTFAYVWYSRDFGISWTQGYQAPNYSVAKNYAISCYHSNLDKDDKCIVVGAYDGNTYINVGRGSSNNFPMNFSNVQIPPPTIQTKYLYVPQGATCSSNDNCVIAGYLMQKANTALQTPVIYHSKDGGGKWIQSTIVTPGPNDAEVINLSDVSCDSSGQKCVATGWYSPSATNRYPAYPLVYVSNDGGVNWDKTIVLPPPSNDSDVNRMNAVKCAPYSGVCMVSGHGGNSSASTSYPISYISYDYGQNWSKASVMQLPSGTINDDVFSVALFEKIVT